MFYQVVKKVMLRRISFLLACCMLSMSVQAVPGHSVILKAGTMIPMSLAHDVHGQSVHVGQMISFKVLNDIVVDGKTVVEAGAMAQGVVSHVKKARMMGLPGELEVAVRSVTAVDGTVIPLSNENLYSEGSNRLAAAVVVTIIVLFGFCIKGGKANLVSGAMVNPCVSSNMQISVE